MSNKEVLFRTPDEIINGMSEWSFNLGRWGKHVWIELYMGYTDYNGWSFAVKPWKIRDFEHGKVCDSCFEDLYVSEYNHINNSYDIYTNNSIREIKRNKDEMKELIRNIEKWAIKVYNIILYSYLDPSEDYSKLLIYFRRNTSDYRLFEEIENRIILGQPILNNDSSEEEPVYRYMALEGDKGSIYDNGINLSYPKNYKFNFTVYR